MMECVIAIEFLRGRDDELLAKEVVIDSKNVIQTHHFMSRGMTGCYLMINYTVKSEFASSFALVYSYGTATCQFLIDLLHIPVHDLQTLNCP
jgi:hypothetical protein